MLDQKKIGLTSGVVTEDVKTKVHFFTKIDLADFDINPKRKNNS